MFVRIFFLFVLLVADVYSTEKILMEQHIPAVLIPPRTPAQNYRTIDKPAAIKIYVKKYAHIPDLPIMDDHKSSPMMFKGNVYQQDPRMKKKIIHFGMGEAKIAENPETILYTHAIFDCIAVAIWDPQTKTAALWHASKQELFNPMQLQYLKEEGFFKELKDKIKDFKGTQVYLISGQWSPDFNVLVNLLTSLGIPITGKRVMPIVRDYDFFDREKVVFDTYVDYEKLPKFAQDEITHNKRLAVMANVQIDAETGKVDFEFVGS